MIVNWIPFFITLGQDINLLTMELMMSRTAKQSAYNFLNIVTLYFQAGFNAQTILMDMEFELQHLLINTSEA